MKGLRRRTLFVWVPLVLFLLAASVEPTASEDDESSLRGFTPRNTDSSSTGSQVHRLLQRRYGDTFQSTGRQRTRTRGRGGRSGGPVRGRQGGGGGASGRQGGGGGVQDPYQYQEPVNPYLVPNYFDHYADPHYDEVYLPVQTDVYDVPSVPQYSYPNSKSKSSSKARKFEGHPGTTAKPARHGVKHKSKSAKYTQYEQVAQHYDLPVYHPPVYDQYHYPEPYHPEPHHHHESSSSSSTSSSSSSSRSRVMSCRSGTTKKQYKQKRKGQTVGRVPERTPGYGQVYTRPLSTKQVTSYVYLNGQYVPVVNTVDYDISDSSDSEDFHLSDIEQYYYYGGGGDAGKGGYKGKKSKSSKSDKKAKSRKYSEPIEYQYEYVYIYDTNYDDECEEEDTPMPTAPSVPTGRPTVTPGTPTSSPSASPSMSPTTMAPTQSPTMSPTNSPTQSPTMSPTIAPTGPPTTMAPTGTPIIAPTLAPTVTTEPPTGVPTGTPTIGTMAPTGSPIVATEPPTGVPTGSPTPGTLTDPPTGTPTTEPTIMPSSDTMAPTTALVVIVPFGLIYTLDPAATPSDADTSTINALTERFLEEIFLLNYDFDTSTTLESFSLELIENTDANGVVTHDYEATVTFGMDSAVVPTYDEVEAQIAAAFEGLNADVYLDLLLNIPGNNQFSNTVDVTYVPAPVTRTSTNSLASSLEETELTRVQIFGVMGAGAIVMVGLAVMYYDNRNRRAVRRRRKKDKVQLTI